MLQATNRMQAPQFAAKTLSFYGSATFSGALPQFKGPEADVYISKPSPENQSDASKPAVALKALLTEAADRKANAAALFKAVTGVSPIKTPIVAVVETPQKAALDQLAEEVKRMAPEQKLSLIREMTGVHSPYSKVAEAVLIRQQLPALRDLMDCAKPRIERPNLAGMAAAFNAMALGLLMLSVVAPASLLFRPELLGKVIAGLAVAVL